MMQRIFIWGTGYIAEQVLMQCSVYEQYDILGFIDNNADKQKRQYKGKSVFGIDVLKEIKPDKIIILTECFEEIKNQIVESFPDMEKIVENKNFFYKQSLLKRYKNSSDQEINQVLEYVRKNDLHVFNYDFVNKYKNLKIDVVFDADCGMYFVRHANKKLYFARYLDNEKEIRNYYKSVLLEQDVKSPHRYLSPQFYIEEGDVVVDAGVAEGSFSLEIIEKAKKIYLIETDLEWIEALQETFKGYEDRVVIINKFLTSLDDGKFATLDSLIKEPVNFIKMDVEGNEWDALLGAKKLIDKSKNLKCAICSYHGDFDESLIKGVMEQYGLECTHTPGYMWFPYRMRQTYVSTRLCRGIIRGVKE